MNGFVEAAGAKKRPWIWAALALILALYVFSALRGGPIASFGTSADDALYFSSAKALASGQGYVLPGFPVHLRATKYPELYPLLLAGIWKIDPHFPGNVNLAVGLTLAFGCAALLFAFLLLRRWPGLGEWQVLGIVALCGFSHYFLRLSYEVGTEVPFTAFMLGSIWLAERRKWGRAGAFATGLLAGLSVGLRSLGIATIAGIGLFMLIRRDWRRLIWFSLAAAPLTLLCLWPALAAASHPTVSGTAASIRSSGWTQTLCYYCSYACNWRMNVSGPGALAAIVRLNLKEVVQEPGFFLFDPLGTRATLWSLVLVMLASVACYVGIARHVREAGWRPLLLVYLLSLPVIVPWPYTPERFLVSFMPLFFGGLWLEGQHFAGLVTGYFRAPHSSGERVVAGLLAAGGLAFVFAATANYVYAVPSLVAREASENRKGLADRAGAYAWIREHTPPNANVIAYEDGLLSLYTGRHSVVPIAWVTQGFYDGSSRYAENDARHLLDVARHIGAQYWLVTRQDYDLTDGVDRAILRQRQNQLLADAPVVYRNAESSAFIYDMAGLGNGDAVTSNR